MSIHIKTHSSQPILHDTGYLVIEAHRSTLGILIWQARGMHIHQSLQTIKIDGSGATTFHQRKYIFLQICFRFFGIKI